MTVSEALAWGRAQLRVPRDADLLLHETLQRDRAFTLAHADRMLEPQQEEQFRAWVLRRQTKEPVQYILGKQEFWGLKLRVTPDVLIPRPETEHLVEAVLKLVSRDATLNIADVGTGSGAIAIALANELPHAHIVATDISGAALDIAKQNAALHGVASRIQLVQCDLLPPQFGNHFDIVASNPPYVAEAERDTLAREVRDYEPAQALFAGEDGLAVYRRLVPTAHAALKPGGALVMELGAGQAEAAANLLSDWENLSYQPDLAGIVRVLIAQNSRTSSV